MQTESLSRHARTKLGFLGMLKFVHGPLREIALGEKLIPGHKAAAGMATAPFSSLLFMEQCSLQVRLNSGFKPSFYGITGNRSVNIE